METKRRQVIEEDLANVEFETSEDVDVVPTFDSMGLREDLLRGIYAYGKIFDREFTNDPYIMIVDDDDDDDDYDDDQESFQKIC